MTATYSDDVALPIEPLNQLTSVRDLTIQQRFVAFDDANRWVYSRLVNMAREWRNAGHDRIGIKTLVENLRWQYGITIGEPFKLNNDFTSRYARKIAAEHPDLAPMFETRQLKAA